MPGKTRSLDALDNEDLTMTKKSFARNAESLDDIGNNHRTMMKRSMLLWTPSLNNLDNEVTVMKRSISGKGAVIGRS